MRKTIAIIFLIIIGLIVFLYLRSPIKPVSWQPEPLSELSGDFAVNNTLDKALLFGKGVLIAGEDLAFDKQGWLHTGLGDGRIVKLKPSDTTNIIEVANTGGRPLGMRFNKQGNLIVADAIKGLISVTPNGEIKILSDNYNGKKLVFVDHLDIAENGDIYFSNASQRYGIENYLLDFIEASASGQVLKYSPSNQQTDLVIDKLFFANGIALGPQDEFLLVAETGRSRVLKYGLRGEQKGKTSVFIDKLPAMPDNLYFDENETFWIALIIPRDPSLEGLASFPSVRKIIGGLPQNLSRPSAKYGFVLGVNPNGKVIHNYQTASKFTGITSVVEYKGKLFLGSLYNDSLAVFDY